MRKNYAFICATTLSCILLSACQSSQPKSQALVEKVDPDIVVMPGLGSKRGATALMGVKPMTFDELSACASKIDSFQQQSRHLKAQDSKIASRKNELDAQTNALEAERTKINTHSSKQVQDFNNRTEHSRKAISQFNADITAYNAKSTEADALNNEINASCANRAYRRSDYGKLAADLRTAIESRSETTDIPLIDDAAAADGTSKSPLHLGPSPRSPN